MQAIIGSIWSIFITFLCRFWRGWTHGLYTLLWTSHTLRVLGLWEETHTCLLVRTPEPLWLWSDTADHCITQSKQSMSRLSHFCTNKAISMWNDVLVLAVGLCSGLFHSVLMTIWEVSILHVSRSMKHEAAECSGMAYTGWPWDITHPL